MLTFGGIPVPWNASWTGEASYGIRPCRWAEGMPAMWQPHHPLEGRPVFAKPHFVRQRQSIARMLCTVCGGRTEPGDRWWFGHGEFKDDWFMTTESPVHLACAQLSLEHCPHLRREGHANGLRRFPPKWSVIKVMLGGLATEQDFGVKLGARQVIGALKLGWPRSMCGVKPPEAA